MRFVIFSCLLIGFSQGIKAQITIQQIDSTLKSAKMHSEEGDKKGATTIYEALLAKLDNSSSYYGDVLTKIIQYYLDNGNELQFLKNYEKLLSSNVNDKDPDFNLLDEPFKNYRYKVTKSIADYYYKKGNYAKTLEYLDLCEFYSPYQTPLLSKYKCEKIDLTFFRFKVYTDLSHKDSAFYVLLKRALEYDYSEQHPFHTSNNLCADEKKLNDLIFSYFPINKSFQEFKKFLDKAIDEIDFKKDSASTRIKMDLNGLTYIIQVSSLKESKEDCQAYLKNSPLYSLLEKKFPKSPSEKRAEN